MTNATDQLDAILDSLLDEQPMAPISADFSRLVMQQIEPQVAIEPFRLRVSDIGLAIVITAVVSVVFTIILAATGILDVNLPALPAANPVLSTGTWTWIGTILAVVELAALALYLRREPFQ